MANTYRRGWVGRRMNADSRIAWGTQFLSEGARISILSMLSPLQAIAAQRDQQREADPACQAADALMQALHQVRFAAMTPVYEREVNDLRDAWDAAHAVALDWSEALRLLHMLMFSGVLVLGSTTLCYSDQAQAAE